MQFYADIKKLVAALSPEISGVWSETTTNTPIVSIKNNTVVANSRNVAPYFGKEHFNVLQDIDKLIKQGVLDFQETPYVHEQNGQTYRSFDMTRDGFTILAMGFTGKKALQFKLRYIEQFNAMEAELKAQAQPAAITATEMVVS